MVRGLSGIETQEGEDDRSILLPDFGFSSVLVRAVLLCSLVEGDEGMGKRARPWDQPRGCPLLLNRRTNSRPGIWQPAQAPLSSINPAPLLYELGVIPYIYSVLCTRSAEGVLADHGNKPCERPAKWRVRCARLPENRGH